MKYLRFFTGIFILSVLLFGGMNFVLAQTSVSDDINVLNQEIEFKQRSIDQLNRQIEEYRKKIEQKQAQSSSLLNEIDLIENRIAKTKLDIESAQSQIDLVNTQIALIEHEIHELEQTLEKDRELISTILLEVQIQDHSLPFQLLFSTDSFSEFFDDLEHLESLSTDLKKAVDTARASKEEYLNKRENEQGKKDQLVSLSLLLEKEQRHLNEVVGAKETLLSTTQASESAFKALLSDVKQEQTYVNQQIAILQDEIEGKLNEHDSIGDSSVLSWPLDPTVRGISTYFHDPTYPFRNLFEHSGLDLPAPTGIPVGSAAPGYVAWTKVGSLYGNYVMVIHSNGFATLYAHLSRIDVVPDQFVARGDQIGAVGSTGFSTGPHLHFEVRKDGIPTDPITHLISY